MVGSSGPMILDRWGYWTGPLNGVASIKRRFQSCYFGIVVLMCCSWMYNASSVHIRTQEWDIDYQRLKQVTVASSTIVEIYDGRFNDILRAENIWEWNIVGWLQWESQRYLNEYSFDKNCCSNILIEGICNSRRNCRTRTRSWCCRTKSALLWRCATSSLSSLFTYYPGKC